MLPATFLLAGFALHASRLAQAPVLESQAKCYLQPKDCDQKRIEGAGGHTRASQSPAWGSKSRTILPPRGHLAMSEDSFGCHNWEIGAIGI